MALPPLFTATWLPLAPPVLTGAPVPRPSPRRFSGALWPLGLLALPAVRTRAQARATQAQELRGFLLALDHKQTSPRTRSKEYHAPAKGAAAEAKDAPKIGAKERFYVVGSWSEWEFEEMLPDSAEEFVLDVTLPEPGGEFQIVCDQDWSRVLYPAGDGLPRVGGPDDGGHGLNWDLDGLPGEVFRVRLCAGGACRRVSWELLRPAEAFDASSLGPSSLAECARTGHWEQALHLLEELWSREKQSLEPSRCDYAAAIAACERSPSEASSSAAEALRTELAERRAQVADRFFLTPRVYWHRDVRRMGCGVTNALDWQGGEPLAAPSASWLLPASDSVAMEIAERRADLREAGWKVLSCCPRTLGKLDDKVELTRLAVELGLQEHFPERYTAPEGATYPCILKPAAGEFGSGVEIVHSPEEVRRTCGELSAQWLLQELVPGCFEFSTSLLVCKGEIMEEACMRYRYDAEVYVWPRVTELGKELLEAQPEHRFVMQKLVQGYSGFINFNYKLRPDGQMCIMEANARIGADLACDVPRPSQALNPDRWNLFLEAFGDVSKQSKKGLTRFMKALHAVIETGEALPVWRHKKDRGLKALTEPIPLKLRHMGQPPGLNISVAAEPLVQLADLVRFLAKVTPCTDEAYLQFCHKLVGHRIRDHLTDKEYEVQSFNIFRGIPIPVHTVTAGESTECWILASRAYSVLSLAEEVPHLELKVALNQLQAVTKAEEYSTALERLRQRINGEPEAPSERSEEYWPRFEQALAKAASVGPEALALLEPSVSTQAAAAAEDPEASDSVDPSMRVHTVMIAVSDEIPFELFWPMVKDDIVAAVRELCPRGAPGMEEAVQQGVVRNGMGPIAQKLTLHEAENLATRVGHVVQTAVTVDQEALQEAQKDKSKTSETEPGVLETIQLTSRVQFSPKGDNTWMPGTVVGQHGDRFSLVDEKGVLYDQLPRARIRQPQGKRDSIGAGGTPMQAVLSQADLMRIREHLRRRQEEWAERHAQTGNGAAPRASEAPAASAGSEQRTPSSSRPTSAALLHRSRASSASIDGAVRRGISMLSREGSLSEDPALDVVQFMEDEGMGDDYDDDGDGGPDDDEDEEDLPTLEPHEDTALPRRGDFEGSMEEELRMLEQLRAMDCRSFRRSWTQRAGGGAGRSSRPWQVSESAWAATTCGCRSTPIRSVAAQAKASR
ncbi:unnamed protein product [Effrenium voratum]|nr:unnamed protein product [Effrenium voratum]